MKPNRTFIKKYIHHKEVVEMMTAKEAIKVSKKPVMSEGGIVGKGGGSV